MERTDMEIRDNELLFIYDSDNIKEREALGYVKSLQYHRVKEYDLRNDVFTELQLKEIAERLSVAPIDLMDHQSDVYNNKYAGTDLSEEDVLTALRHEPKLIRTPIILLQDQAHFMESPYEFLKEDMASRGVRKDPQANESPGSDQ